MNTAHLGREVELRALGQTWRLARWTRALWDEFLIWARTQLPDPTVQAEAQLLRLALREQELQEKANLLVHQAMTASAAAPGQSIPDSPELQKLQREIAAVRQLSQQIVDRALGLACDYCGLGSPRIQALLHSAEGAIYLLWLLLRQHQPSVTRDDAMHIAMEVGGHQKLHDYFDTASGVAGNGAAPLAA